MSEPSEEAKSSTCEISVSGVIDILSNKSGQLLDPKRNGKTQPTDPFVPRELIKRFKIKKKGSYLNGVAHKNERYPNPKGTLCGNH